MAKEPFEAVNAQELIGKTLDGRYRIDGVLGQGGMGMVFKGVQTSVQRPVAVKTLHPQLAMAPTFFERFKREAEIASRLHHPNIITIFDFGRTSDGFCYYVMELLAGESLRQRIKRDGPLTLRQAAAVIEQTVQGVAHAHHQNVIHRDLKPHNIMLTSVDGNEYVKVLDFGLVKAMEQEDEEQLTSTGQVLGTPQYMPPEQAGGESVDQRSDLFSLASVFFYCLTGHSPYGANSVRKALTLSLAGNVPPVSTYRQGAPVPKAIDEFLFKALRPEKEDRFQTAEDFLEGLHAAMSGTPDSVLDAIPAFTPEASNKDSGSGSSSASRKGSSRSRPPSKAISAVSRPIPRSASRASQAEEPSRPSSTSQARSPLMPLVGLAALLVVGIGLALAWKLSQRAPAEPPPAILPPIVATGAAPTPPPPMRVILNSTPSGAEVSEGGVTLGNTPVTLEWEKGATRTFTLRAPGFLDLSRTLRAESDQTFDLSLDAEPSRPSKPAQKDPSKKPPKPDPDIGAFE